MYCLRQLFCFVAFPSASGQTRQMGMVRQGSLLTWLSIRIRLQGHKPRESNKLFDLFFLPTRGSRSSKVQGVRPHPIRGRRRTSAGQAHGSSKVIVRSLRRRLILYCQGQLFCFVAFPSASGQTRQMGRVRQGSLLTWLSIRIGLQGRKPRGKQQTF